MDVKDAVAETIKNLIIPELTEIKEKLVLVETRLDGFEKRFDDMIFEDKVSKEDFRLLDKRYLELLGEVSMLKERVAQQG